MLLASISTAQVLAIFNKTLPFAKCLLLAKHVHHCFEMMNIYTEHNLKHVLSTVWNKLSVKNILRAFFSPKKLWLSHLSAASNILSSEVTLRSEILRILETNKKLSSKNFRFLEIIKKRRSLKFLLIFLNFFMCKKDLK